MKVPPEVWFQPVGHCIYCMRTVADLQAAGERAKLSPEHIIPFSFGGHWVLPEASCEKCADITGAIEGKCCSSMFRAFRVHANIPTRRKKNRPTHLRILDGEHPANATSRDVPVHEAPGVVVLPVFGPPQVSLGWQASPKIEMGRIAWWPTTDDSLERSRKLKERGFASALVTAEVPLGEFMRVLAKIAHGYLISQPGSKNAKPLLQDIILGRGQNISFLVGGTFPMSPIPLNMPGPQSANPTHQVQPLAVSIDGVGYIAVQIRLFASLDPLSPVYTVIAGERPLAEGDQYPVIATKNRKDAVPVKVSFTFR